MKPTKEPPKKQAKKKLQMEQPQSKTKAVALQQLQMRF